MRRRVRNRAVRLKHLNASGKFPSGNTRYYYRPKGQKGIPLPDFAPDSVEFKEAYIEAVKGRRVVPGKAASGSIEAGVQAYLASDIHLGKAPSTRALEKRFGQEIAAKYGHGILTTLKPVHIRKALSEFDAHPANNRLRLWRAMGRFWVDRGMIETDPARDVRARATPKATGAIPWTRDDFQAFRNHWPIGSSQRLAFELMYQTCAAVVDIVRLGPANVHGDWLCYTRQKSKAEAVSPLANAPAWFEPTGALQQSHADAPKLLTYLTTQAAASRSHNAVASWFSRACTEAGLPDRSAHGVRKGRAAIFKENGADVEKRMAILGHETESEARGYSKSADLIRTISGTEVPTKVPTLRHGPVSI